VVDPDRVAAVTAAMPGDDDVEELAQVFGLLADRGRVRLMAALLEGGEMCVCDLAAAARQSESGVSHALRLLRAHRVVTVRRSGRMAYYRLADSHVRMLLDLALAHIGHQEGTPSHGSRSRDGLRTGASGQAHDAGAVTAVLRGRPDGT
jgi:DNA-binding transcriptional ArsR family regulator